MSHQIIIPSGDSGGDGRMAVQAEVVITWSPPHDMTPAAERRRIERAEQMRADILAMLARPYNAMEDE